MTILGFFLVSDQNNILVELIQVENLYAEVSKCSICGLSVFENTSIFLLEAIFIQKNSIAPSLSLFQIVYTLNPKSLYEEQIFSYLNFGNKKTRICPRYLYLGL